VQQLITGHHWKNKNNVSEKYHHVGTIPTKESKIFVADIRFIVSFDFKKGCFRPVAIYARRAKEPLSDVVNDNANSWSMLGTSLSVQNDKVKKYFFFIFLSFLSFFRENGLKKIIVC
jgi:hypothetical protein